MSENGVNRRSFLKLSGAGLGLAAAGTLLPALPATAKQTKRGNSWSCGDWAPISLGVGFNETNRNRPQITDATYEAAIRDFQAPVFRFPGGTVANFWDWQKGWIDYDLLVGKWVGQLGNAKPQIPWLLEDVKQFADDTGSIPLFVPNIFTSDLNYQMAMLEHAEAVGLPVKYVELGNEFYLNSYQQFFPDVSDYAVRAGQWASAIKARFPAAEVAVVGWDDNQIFPITTRQSGWNAGLEAVVGSNPAVSAISTHPYAYIYQLRAMYGQVLDLSPVNCQRLVATAFDPLNDVSRVAAAIPNHQKVWITEYNTNDSAVGANHWIQGIWAAVSTMELLREERIELATFHSLSGAFGFAATFDPPYAEIFKNKFGVDMVPWGLTAAGVGLRVVYRALHGATHYQTIDFVESSDISVDVAGSTRTYPALLGFKFLVDDEERSVIANLSQEPITVNLHRYDLPPSGTWTQYSAAPTDLIVDHTTDVTTSTGPVSAHVTLAPYSLTSVTGRHRGRRGAGGGGHGHGRPGHH